MGGNVGIDKSINLEYLLDVNDSVNASDFVLDGGVYRHKKIGLKIVMVICIFMKMIAWWVWVCRSL